ncbi:MAG TPA: class I SAM-dependent methyltransferase [Pyrinomonadaceae bacterium]|nr:class I SAM-dependent methyltransferase [Pyrinomonadaceae bacterium]
MITEDYQHPATYVSTGNPAVDFQYSVEVFEADLSSYLPEDKETPILDVGCGWGQFLWWLREKEYTNIQGIDIGKAQAAHGNSIGLDIICVEDSTSFLENADSKYELIVMNHIIEHMPAAEGIKILKAIYKALRPNGRVVVQTPNLCAIGANHGRYIEISHVTGYTESSLHQIVTLAGFTNIELFGSKTAFRLAPRRLILILLQLISRAIWRIMLLAEWGTDAPKIIQRNLYATAIKPPQQ